MALPPVNLLLPHQFTFDDKFIHFPLHITSPTPSALLTLLLLHHVHAKGNAKSIILHTGDKDSFGDSLLDESGSNLAHFFKSDAYRKGKFLKSAGEIDVVHFTTLHELRSLLNYLLTRKTQYVAASAVVKEQAKEVPDSQASSGGRSEYGDGQQTEWRPVLAVCGFDEIHFLAGSSSAQSLSRTLSSAVETADAIGYNLIIHDVLATLTYAGGSETGGNEDMPEDNVCDAGSSRSVNVLDQLTDLPQHLIDIKIPLARLYARFMRYEWMPSASGASEGLWYKFDGFTESGRGQVNYKVTWNATEDGLAQDTKILRM